MTEITTESVTAVPLADLAGSWLMSLAIEGKSRHTLAAYRAAVDQFLGWHAAQGQGEPVLDRSTARAFPYDLRESGGKPCTVRLRQCALTRFADWLADEGETDGEVLAGLRPPKLDQPNVPRLTDAEMARLVRACKGPGFRDRRDEALVRLMCERLLRAGETVALTLDDVNVKAGVVRVVRGKGGKGGIAPFGRDTQVSLDRYLRLRRKHKLAHRPEFWLPAAGRAFTYGGLTSALRGRA